MKTPSLRFLAASAALLFASVAVQAQSTSFTDGSVIDMAGTTPLSITAVDPLVFGLDNVFTSTINASSFIPGSDQVTLTLSFQNMTGVTAWLVDQSMNTVPLGAVLPDMLANWVVTTANPSFAPTDSWTINYTASGSINSTSSLLISTQDLVPAIPEPSTNLMLLIGLATVAYMARRKLTGSASAPFTTA